MKTVYFLRHDEQLKQFYRLFDVAKFMGLSAINTDNGWMVFDNKGNNLITLNEAGYNTEEDVLIDIILYRPNILKKRFELYEGSDSILERRKNRKEYLEKQAYHYEEILKFINTKEILIPEDGITPDIPAYPLDMKDIKEIRSVLVNHYGIRNMETKGELYRIALRGQTETT